MNSVNSVNSMTRSLNRKLLEDILYVAKREPSRINMSFWMGRDGRLQYGSYTITDRFRREGIVPNAVNDDSLCGCFVGWSIFLRPQEAQQARLSLINESPRSNTYHMMKHVGAELVGIESDVAEYAFIPFDWPNRYIKMIGWGRALADVIARALDENSLDFMRRESRHAPRLP